MNPLFPAWECRDQAEQAELYYNHPLRAKNRRLEDENLALKRLLRENGISWHAQKSAVPATRLFNGVQETKALPHLPVEIQLRILSYALTSPHPIVDPLSKLKPERLIASEKAKPHYLAIHFLETCRAYHVEGTKLLWSNNSYIFTTPEALRTFAELDYVYRKNVSQVTFRLIAKFYDDQDRVHRLPRTHHPDLKKAVKLAVHKRAKENNMARRGFRAYAWYQLVDFLEAMLPPFDPSSVVPTSKELPPPVRPRLFPSLEKLRIDFVNFGDDLFQFPPSQLHDLASHQLGCTLNEIILTGVPRDECGLRVSTELSGLLRDEGLLIDHEPTMVTLKNGIRLLRCRGKGDSCHYSSKVVRAMRTVSDHLHLFDDDDHVRHSGVHLPSAPAEEGEPPASLFHSCRTIWKKVPVKINGDEERRWELFDRVSGLPWEDVEEEATMFDSFDDDDEEGIVCENCGEAHPGALLPEELVDLFDGM